MRQSGLDPDIQGVSWRTVLTSRSDALKKTQTHLEFAVTCCLRQWKRQREPQEPRAALADGPGRRAEPSGPSAAGRRGGGPGWGGPGRPRPPPALLRVSPVPPRLLPPRSAAGRGVRRRGAAAQGEAERPKWRHRWDGEAGGAAAPGERGRGRGWGGSTVEPGTARPPGPVCGSGARRSLRPCRHPAPVGTWPPPPDPGSTAAPLCFPSSALWHCRGLALVCFVGLGFFSLEKCFNLLRVMS